MYRLRNHIRATDRMPVLFIGHGTPMNAVEDNEFSRSWKRLAGILPRPKAIVCISAHWQAGASLVTAAEYPETIHDFGGFPRELYMQRYPAPGSPGLAVSVAEKAGGVGTDRHRGIDHGAWCFLKHMYPDADIPVVQLSIDYTKDMRHHYELARRLRFLRESGILVAGSGNMVHNLAMARTGTDGDLNTGHAYGWASHLNRIIKEKILSGDSGALVDYRSLSEDAVLGIPTEEHYVPLIYAAGLKNEDDTVEVFNDRVVGGSVSMTSLVIGNKAIQKKVQTTKL